MINNILDYIRKESVTIMIAIILLGLLLYVASYSQSYDRIIEQHYRTIVEQNCTNQLGLPVFKRPQPFTLPSFEGKLYEVTTNASQSKDNNS